MSGFWIHLLVLLGTSTEGESMNTKLSPMCHMWVFAVLICGCTVEQAAEKERFAVGAAVIEPSAPSDTEADEVLRAAARGMGHYLKKIPVGREALYGFNGREELARAAVGLPLRVFHTDDAHLKENPNVDDTSQDYCT